MGQEVLQRVVARLGGPEQAAARLGVSATLMQRFLSGSRDVPDALLLRAVDLVSEPEGHTPALHPQSSPPKGPIVI